MRHITFDRQQFGDAILEWYIANDRDLPWRKLWACHRDPYHIWLSEIMLQQTLIKVVVPAYTRFLDTFPTVQDVARADEEAVRLACRGLGYYRRFGLFHKATRQLAAQKNFVWPSSYEDWKTLPGIGGYTAAAIASIVNGEAVAVLDGNVERVLCRLLDIREPVGTPRLKNELQPIAQSLLNSRHPGDYNQGMMELGQLACTKANPDCENCPVRAVCLAYKNGSQALAPAAKARAEPVEVSLALLLSVDDKGHLGILQRDADARFLANLAGFPTFLVKDKDWMEPLGFVLPGALLERKNMTKIGTIRHNITHHKIVGHVYRYEGTSCADLRFVAPHDLEPQLVSNLDRKALTCFLKHRMR
jgi:A/G-specific adenine glycosylase